MNETLAAIQAWPVLRSHIIIGGVHEKVRDGRLVDEPVLSVAIAGIDGLFEAIRTALRSSDGMRVATAVRTGAAGAGGE
jgi:chromate reductase, NAD(P)H dehydrogenase (quinone)